MSKEFVDIKLSILLQSAKTGVLDRNSGNMIQYRKNYRNVYIFVT